MRSPLDEETEVYQENIDIFLQDLEMERRWEQKLYPERRVKAEEVPIFPEDAGDPGEVSRELVLGGRPEPETESGSAPAEPMHLRVRAEELYHAAVEIAEIVAEEEKPDDHALNKRA